MTFNSSNNLTPPARLKSQSSTRGASRSHDNILQIHQVKFGLKSQTKECNPNSKTCGIYSKQTLFLSYFTGCCCMKHFWVSKFTSDETSCPCEGLHTCFEALWWSSTEDLKCKQHYRWINPGSITAVMVMAGSRFPQTAQVNCSPGSCWGSLYYSTCHLWSAFPPPWIHCAVKNNNANKAPV